MAASDGYDAIINAIRTYAILAICAQIIIERLSAVGRKLMAPFDANTRVLLKFISFSTIKPVRLSRLLGYHTRQIRAEDDLAHKKHFRTQNLLIQSNWCLSKRSVFAEYYSEELEWYFLILYDQISFAGTAYVVSIIRAIFLGQKFFRCSAEQAMAYHPNRWNPHELEMPF